MFLGEQLNFRHQGKEEQTKPKASRREERKEALKMRTERKYKTVARINGNKNWLFEHSNKIDRLLNRLSFKR